MTSNPIEGDPNAIQVPGMDPGIIIRRGGIWQDVYIDVGKNRRVTMGVEAPTVRGRICWICYLGLNPKWSDGSPITEKDKQDIERNIQANSANEGYEGSLGQIGQYS